jgi:hypothetical protein
MPAQYQVNKSSPPIMFLKETKKRRTHYGQGQSTDAKAIRETQA